MEKKLKNIQTFEQHTDKNLNKSSVGYGLLDSLDNLPTTVGGYWLSDDKKMDIFDKLKGADETTIFKMIDAMDEDTKNKVHHILFR